MSHVMHHCGKQGWLIIHIPWGKYYRLRPSLLFCISFCCYLMLKCDVALAVIFYQALIIVCAVYFKVVYRRSSSYLFKVSKLSETVLS